MRTMAVFYGSSIQHSVKFWIDDFCSSRSAESLWPKSCAALLWFWSQYLCNVGQSGEFVHYHLLSLRLELQQLCCHSIKCCSWSVYISYTLCAEDDKCLSSVSLSLVRINDSSSRSKVLVLIIFLRFPLWGEGIVTTSQILKTSLLYRGFLFLATSTTTNKR